MHTEAENHLTLIKQALLEKQFKSQQQLDELFNQDDIPEGTIDELNKIIDTAQELIDAIENELPGHKHVVQKEVKESYLTISMKKFEKMGWKVERLDYPDEFLCTLVSKKPVDKNTGKQGVVQFEFDDLEGNSLKNVSAFTIKHELIEVDETKDF